MGAKDLGRGLLDHLARVAGLQCEGHLTGGAFFSRRLSRFSHEEVKVDDGLHAPQAVGAADLAA